MSEPVTVVLGPRTRLGAELVRNAVARGERVIALARHDKDAEALAELGGAVEVIDPPTLGSLVGQPDAVRLHVCAMGPVHTWQEQVDPAEVARDLSMVEAVLEWGGAAAHVVQVSSVVALAPGPDRRSYGGWKNLVEHEVRAAAQRHGAEFSVVYPGRLVERSDGRIKNLLHTPYPRAASLVEKSGSKAPTARVIGADARIWLLVHGLKVMVRGVVGSGGTGQGRSAVGGRPAGKQGER
ncbi:hypothetical protein [Nocardioides sp. AE5]|uniref:hypothetical protein n=1 Tax=Nocardioides sp. AE5 TaxID=2962573 RepID=UPI0028828703|nr:hypothetical protein [Nocardioides sp. AE5]MDT0202587.1 hypothetical protein [Nocardioides sp. AE5]